MTVFPTRVAVPGRTVPRLLAPRRSGAGRRVLVTGASGTFGQAIGSAFLAAGARVVGVDQHPREDSAFPVLPCDITVDTCTEVVQAAIEQLGGLDVLVNNAGVGGPAPAELAPDEVVAQQLAVNLVGAWRVTAAAMPALLVSRGRVVVLSSRMAVLPLPLAAAYGASKRALVAWADALRHEVGDRVAVTTVYPSMVRSPIHDSTADAGLSLEGMSRFEPLEGVVDTVLHAALAVRPRRDLPTTRRGAVEFFLGRHAPALTDRVVSRQFTERLASGALDGAPLARRVTARRHETSRR